MGFAGLAGDTVYYGSGDGRGLPPAPCRVTHPRNLGGNYAVATVPADLKGVSKRRADGAQAVSGHELVLLVVQQVQAQAQGQGQDVVQTTTQTVLVYSVNWSRLLVAVRAPRSEHHDSNNTYLVLYDVPEKGAAGPSTSAAAAGQAGGLQLTGSPLHGATDGACELIFLPNSMGVSAERGLHLAHVLMQRLGQRQERASDAAWRPLLHLAPQGQQPRV